MGKYIVQDEERTLLVTSDIEEARDLTRTNRFRELWYVPERVAILAKTLMEIGISSRYKPKS